MAEIVLTEIRIYKFTPREFKEKLGISLKEDIRDGSDGVKYYKSDDVWTVETSWKKSEFVEV